MDISVKYVRDNRNSQIYSYHPSMEPRIGKTLEFCEQPKTDPILKLYMTRMFVSLEEIRDAANKIGLMLPYDTTMTRAAEMYMQRVIYLYDRRGLPEQIAEDTKPKDTAAPKDTTPPKAATTTPAATK